jgi:sugar phosphate isomerase/epimerase
LLLTSVLGCYQEKVSQKDVCWRDIPFFAMDTGTKDENHQSAESQIKMLKELGYDGIGYWTGSGGLEEVLRQLDLHGLKAFPVYRGISLDNNGPVCPDDVREAIEGLKGRPYASVWLYIGTSKIYENSSPQGDPKAVAMLREIADIAEASGVKIILYPHYDSWLERVEDAVRVAEKVDRPNVGISFNLCHWLKTDDQANLRPVLEMAMPYLFVVTINGADSGGANWSQLIQPLGQGSFDTYILLKELKDLGYFGPVGLQGFGIGGDVYQNLKQSMQAWNALVAKLDEDCQVK